ncbi:MAG: GAF domain-containing protein, partial [Thermodesulfobacteriota bacterium]
MESVIRCRKCGKKMNFVKVDDYRIKSTCSCGYSEYKTASAASKTINPHLSKQNMMPLVFDETGKFFFEAERANREKKEIITLEELSMLASSDYDIKDVLKTVAEKTAHRIGVDICSIYLWEEGSLVLEGTFGLSQDAVGVARLKSGEGITGTALKNREPLLIEDVSTDERYHFFPETREEQYKIKSM